ncbi:hypothetical protein CEXT_776571 [Caerostris extrusa]|uniref:Uncharacterized protein n=1 Tax=Caerostris extrusa TaxID=172846 RepID=A0AAV4WHN3_CAEEX|nr:hypothetical protein CEXT_776571 [Caerostris extrusa]
MGEKTLRKSHFFLICLDLRRTESTFFTFPLSGPIRKTPDEICARPCSHFEKPLWQQQQQRPKMSTNKYPNALLKCHYPKTVKANAQVKMKDALLFHPTELHL